MYFLIIMKANIYRERCSLGNKCYYYRGEYNLEIVSSIHYKKEYYL